MVIEKLTIFIIDDEIDLLEVYRDLFEMEGFNVLSASSGAEALKVYQENLKIDLIISDINLGDLKGPELLKKLKALDRKLPFFYFSTGEISVSAEEIKAIGADDLILKPFNLEEVINKIQNVLKK